jgi:hypothetical protein
MIRHNKRRWPIIAASMVGLLALVCFARRPALPSKPLPSSLSGNYYFGDGLGTNCSLTLTTDQTFTFVWRGCLGVYDQNAGTYRLDKGVLILSPKRPNVQKGFKGTPTRFLVVPWGERQYLVPTSEVVAFCNEINAGLEPRQEMHGRVYLRDGDEKKRTVTRFPSLPAQWQEYLLPHEVTGQVLALPSDKTALINRGARDGFRAGMELYDRNINSLCLLEIISCRNSNATVQKKYTFDHEPLQVGDHVTTRFFAEETTASIGLVRVTPPPAPKNATKRVKLDPGPTDYRWLSAQEALLLRQTSPSLDASVLVRYSLLTGKEQPLSELTARVGNGGHGSIENAKVSGDGRWVLEEGPDVHGDFGLLLYSLDGGVGRLPALLRGRSIDDAYWIGTGHRLLAFEDARGKATRAVVIDLDKPEQTRQVALPSGIGLPFNSFGDAHVCVTATDDLVFADWDTEQPGAVTHSIRIVQLHLGNVPSTPQSFLVRLPPGAKLFQIALSPTGNQVVWELAFDRGGKSTVELWLSDRDGGRMHAIERIPLWPDDIPDIKLGSHSIHWTPDGKLVSFVYDYALWTVPAN